MCFKGEYANIFQVLQMKKSLLAGAFTAMLIYGHFPG